MSKGVNEKILIHFSSWNPAEENKWKNRCCVCVSKYIYRISGENINIYSYRPRYKLHTHTHIHTVYINTTWKRTQPRTALNNFAGRERFRHRHPITHTHAPVERTDFGRLCCCCCCVLAVSSVSVCIRYRVCVFIYICITREDWCVRERPTFSECASAWKRRNPPIVEKTTSFHSYLILLLFFFNLF